MKVSATVRAGIVLPVVSNPGRPDPLLWAKLTTDMIVTPAPDATMDERLRVGALRRRVAALLFEEFCGLKKTTIAVQAALHIEERLFEIVKPTQWAENFAVARIAISDVLIRNVMSFIEILGN